MNQRNKTIYDIVKRIPKGRVATYGQVARLAGFPRHARHVGYALSASPKDLCLPWHRVINAQGSISERSEPYGPHIQRSLLEKEGIAFSSSGKISLRDFQWRR